MGDPAPNSPECLFLGPLLVPAVTGWDAQEAELGMGEVY